MKVSVLCSSQTHPVYAHLARWREARGREHEIELVETAARLPGGDLLFLISCHEVIGPEQRARYRACLVVHASNLPHGRGWSPLVWQILEGRNEIPVTLLEAGDTLDSGDIWHQVWLRFDGHELVDEMHVALFAAELELMDYALAHLDSIRPTPQSGTPTHYRRRTPEDSRLDMNRSLAEQFNLLRVADPLRYPAFFDYLGHRYELRIKKADPDER